MSQTLTGGLQTDGMPSEVFSPGGANFDLTLSGEFLDSEVELQRRADADFRLAGARVLEWTGDTDRSRGRSRRAVSLDFAQKRHGQPGFRVFAGVTHGGHRN